MTVSRALRNAPGVSTQTKRRILKIAREHGYEVDPKLQQMLGYMRKVRTQSNKSLIAWIWPEIDIRTAASYDALQKMLSGARERADVYGFGLDEFSLAETDLKPKRLASILQNRGVQCVILAPIFRQAHGSIDFPWRHFSSVLIGRGLWKPELHRVHLDHFGAMVLMMEKLSRGKRKRIAFITDSMLDERMHHSWSGAFLTNHPLGLHEATQFVHIIDPSAPEVTCDWMKNHHVDTAILAYEGSERLPRHSDAPKHIEYLTMSYSEAYPQIGGIDQNDRALGAYAVDMVSALFQRGERGIPKAPQTMLCHGIWREAVKHPDSALKGQR